MTCSWRKPATVLHHSFFLSKFYLSRLCFYWLTPREKIGCPSFLTTYTQLCPKLVQVFTNLCGCLNNSAITWFLIITLSFLAKTVFQLFPTIEKLESLWLNRQNLSQILVYLVLSKVQCWQLWVTIKSRVFLKTCPVFISYLVAQLFLKIRTGKFCKSYT